jgi:D-glycero-alpha-D-manno-heptose-7-phosphate kinase
VIGSMTPFRISFAGGGSDLKAFYQRTPGCVVSTTIKKYMYLFVHPSFDEMTQVKYSQTELVTDIEEIRHPIVRETLRMFGLRSVDISSIADIPAGTGLGSSSSFTVGLLHALYAYIGKAVTAEQMAREACRLEIDILKEPIGRQDQYAAAYGGLNLITFNADEGVTVEAITMTPAAYSALTDNLLMFFTGTVRNAGRILSDQTLNIANPREASNLLRMTTSTTWGLFSMRTGSSRRASRAWSARPISTVSTSSRKRTVRSAANCWERGAAGFFSSTAARKIRKSCGARGPCASWSSRSTPWAHGSS